MGIARTARHNCSRWAHDIGEFQSRVLLTIFYFTLFVPFALLLRLFSDPLHLRRRPEPSAWTKAAPPDGGIEAARRQF